MGTSLELSTLNLNNVKTALNCRAKAPSYSKTNKPTNVKHISPHTSPDKKTNEHGKIVVNRIRQEQKHLKGEEIDLLISEYKNGKTTYELADQFGCHRITVSNILKKYGIEVSKCYSKKKLDVDNVVAMYANMNTTQQIADKYGVGPNVILRCLRERGVAIRGRWDY